MAKSRLELQTLLESIAGVKHAYFQPPEAHKLVYPCIKYGFSGIKAIYAGNSIHSFMNKYTLTVIDANPDSEIPKIVRELTYAKFDRAYTAEGLNHTVYSIYY